jgi:hypothetical protein
MTIDGFEAAIKNKIVADIGSNTGRMIPVLSFFEPTKIVSIEPLQKFLNVQREFLKNKFSYLKKKIITNIDFYEKSIDDIIDNNINFDTAFFMESICCLYAPYNEIKDSWFYDEITNEYEKTFAILKKLKTKNIIIFQSNISFLEKKYRKVTDMDYIDMLKELDYQDIKHTTCNMYDEEKFCIIAFR